MNSISPDRRTLVRSALGLGGLAGLAGCGARGATPERPFVVGVNQMPTVLDPAKDGGGGTNRPIYENVVETLVARTPKGDITPGLAAWTLSPDAKSVVFHLRRGVRFHNGDELTAKDIVFSHERMKQYNQIYKGRIRTLKLVEPLDDYNVRFVFSRPCYTYLRVRALQVMSKAEHERAGEEAFTARPVGTGPYRLIRHKRYEYADLEAFDGYWGGTPAIRNVRLVFVQEDMTRVAMLRSGEADMIMATPFPMVPVLEKAGYRAAQVDMHPTFSVRFQLANRNTPWADYRVRLAIAHAIDTGAIVKGLFGDLPQRYPSFAPGEPGYDASIQRHPYDPGKARRLLAEAGYPRGFRMPLTYWSGAYYGSRETAEAVSLYLGAMGIRCEVEGIDSTQGLAMNRAVAKDPKARAVTIAPALLASYSDPMEALRQGYSSESPFSWYHDKDFDTLLNGALNAADERVQAEYLQRCARKLHADLPIIPLWNNITVYMMKPDVRYVATARDIPSLLVKNAQRA